MQLGMEEPCFVKALRFFRSVGKHFLSSSALCGIWEEFCNEEIDPFSRGWAESDHAWHDSPVMREVVFS
jgi:hypothetical protein